MENKTDMPATAESQLVNHLPVLIFELNSKGRILYLGGALRNSMNLNTQELVGKNFWEWAVPADGYQTIWGVNLDEIATSQLNFQAIVTEQQGSKRVMEFVLQLNRSEQTREAPITGFGFEILDHRPQPVPGEMDIEDALKDSQELFEHLYQSTPDATLLVEAGGAILRANQAAQQMFGYEVDELVGQPVEVLLPSKYTRQHFQNRNIFQKKPAMRPMGLGLELYGKRKNGDEFPVDVILSPTDWHGQLLVICVVRDISARREVEQNLREKDELIRTALSSAPIIIYMLERDGTIRLAMGESVGEANLNAGGMSGKNIFEVYPNVPEIRKHFQLALDGKRSHAVLELRGRIYDARYGPLQGEHGEVLGVIGAAMDITERRRTEQAIFESEARFRAIFEQTDAGIKLVAPDGRILDSNPALRTMLGYSADEIRQLHYEELTYTDDRAISRMMFTELIEGHRESYRMEKRYLCKDGSVLWGLVTVSIVRDQEGNPRYLIMIIENISDRKQIQDELEEVRRRLMDSLEMERLHLARDLHDGPVQDLYGVTYQLEDLRDDLVTKHSSETIDAAQILLRKVVRSLREICGELRPPALAPFGLEKAIRSHADKFCQEYPQLYLNLDLSPDGQLLPEAVRLALFRIYQQMLVNVVRHANASQVWVRFKLLDDQAILEIEDDGAGFEAPSRWIDLVREGHLGLAGAAERAEAIGGKLEVKTSPGEGTLIRVWAPISIR
jgi:PAS domain S-box-containing protein